MTTERWQQVNQLFMALVELEPAQRPAILDQSCSNDPALRSEVESLLESDGRGWNLVERPALEVAAPLLANEQSQHPPGKLFSHYQILSLIGKGGMGEVYLATDSELGRNVAIKVLPDEFTRDEGRLQRFRQEARAASALNHPNILTIHEIGRVENQRFIATEFVDGETLRQRLKRAPLTLSDTLEISIQVASALAAAHQAGIVHRDIKPENIMLRQDGYVKVLDFGLAKLTEQQDRTARADTVEETNLSSGLVMGTVKYMSPEQARGEQVDFRSDIFSFGVVLYEMLCAHTPFEGRTSRELLGAILKKEPPPLTRVPEVMNRVVNKVLRKKKEQRYQTIQDLLRDLKDIKQDEAAWAGGVQMAPMLPGSIVPTSPAVAIPTESTVKYVVSGIKRHKISAALILATLALLGSSLILSLYRLGRWSQAPPLKMTTTVTVPGNAGPWLASLNPAFPYTANNDYAAPAVVSSASGIPFVAGSNIAVTYANGAFTADGGRTYFDANGSDVLTNHDSSNGRFPGYYLNSGPIEYGGKLIGVFANNGVLVGTPFPIGNGPTMLTIPAGATELMMGINDNYYSDNSGSLIVHVTSALMVTIPSNAGPWNPGLNATFDYGVHDNASPVVIDASSGMGFTPGSALIVIYHNGTVQAGVGYPFNDANGLQNYVTNSSGEKRFPGFYMNPGPDVYSMELVGTFANNGVIVGVPFPIGNCPAVLTIPADANQLLLGINDNHYIDNSGSFTVAVSTLPTIPNRVPQPSHGPNKGSGCALSILFSRSAPLTLQTPYRYQNSV